MHQDAASAELAESFRWWRKYPKERRNKESERKRMKDFNGFNEAVPFVGLNSGWQELIGVHNIVRMRICGFCLCAMVMEEESFLSIILGSIGRFLCTTIHRRVGSFISSRYHSVIVYNTVPCTNNVCITIFTCILRCG